MSWTLTNIKSQFKCKSKFDNENYCLKLELVNNKGKLIYLSGFNNFVPYKNDIIEDNFKKISNTNYETKKLVYLESNIEKFSIEKFAPFVNGNNINTIFKELSDAIYHIERNGNAKIILTDLSIKLTRLIHKN
jgi:hypothetical protein